jgi:phosphatidylserine decarboxylase
VPIDPSGFPFIAGALAVAAGLAAWLGFFFALPFLLLAGFFTFFFRDPERRPPAAVTTADVLSPADGRVLVAGASTGDVAPAGAWKQISIFLSPMDVHVNRVPVSGRVTRVLMTRGRFLPAYRPDAATVNERSEIWIDHAGQTIVARQIVGVLARRVVCRLQGGEAVQAGQRFGVMKFGSRMDVFVPADADVTVRVGDTVRGGETIIAVLHSPQL